jgi:hypothetical protein
MATYSSKELLENQQQQTEQLIRKAVGEWQNAPVQLLNKIPAEGGWSAAQCMEHLNIYGRYYLPAIENAIKKARLSNNTAVKSFKSGWLGNYFTRLMLPGEQGQVEKKMKTPANAQPPKQLDATKVVAEFIDQQERLLQLLNAATDINLNAVRIPISIAKFIRLKLGDVFMFLIAHNLRHVIQAERAMHGIQPANAFANKSLIRRELMAKI